MDESSGSVNTRFPAPRVGRQRLAAWMLCLVLLCVGALFLNGAFFSAWMANGPPNEHPLGWERRALAPLCFAAVGFVLSAGIFKVVSVFPTLTRSTLVVVLVGLALAAAPYIGFFILQDRCQDDGGAWSRDHLECNAVAR